LLPTKPQRSVANALVFRIAGASSDGMLRAYLKSCSQRSESDNCQFENPHPTFHICPVREAGEYSSTLQNPFQWGSITPSRAGCPPLRRHPPTTAILRQGDGGNPPRPTSEPEYPAVTSRYVRSPNGPLTGTERPRGLGPFTDLFAAANVAFRLAPRRRAKRDDSQP